MNNGVDKIVESIIGEATAYAEDAARQATAQAEKTVKDATAAAEQRTLEKMIKAKKDAAATLERAKSSASLEVRKKKLSAKREVIDEVFDRVELALTGMERSRYAAFLASYAKAGGNGGELVFSQNDYALRETVLKLIGDGRYTVSDKTADNIQSGFMLVNGAIETNCSIHAIVSENRARLEPTAAKILFDK